MSDRLFIERFRVDDFLSNAYLLYSRNSLDNSKAIVVDPNISERLRNKIVEFGITELLLILTHEHFDHTTGVNGLQKEFRCKVICQKHCAERIASKRNNRPLGIMSPSSDSRKYLHYAPFEITADICFDKELTYDWCGHELHFVHTPGHAEGACCIEIEDIVFVGDVLLPDRPVITRFPGGSQQDHETVTLPYLRTIPQDRTICPGHYDIFRMCSVKEKDGYFISAE